MTLPTGSMVLRRHFEHDRLTRVWVGRTVSDDERGLALCSMREAPDHLPRSQRTTPVPNDRFHSY